MHNKIFSYFVVIFFTAMAVLVIVNLEPYHITNENNSSAAANIYLQAPPKVPKVNINTATEFELMNLPGIGETKANLIIENRPYSDTWQLLEIEGIGAEVFKNIMENIEV